MPCLIGLLALLTPRLVIILLALFSTYLHRAYDTWIWPVLGFFLLPFTTLAYAWAINARGEVSGWYTLILILAAFVDIGSLAESSRKRRRR